MSNPGTAPHRPDPAVEDWDPHGMDLLAERTLQGLATAAAWVRAVLVARPRLRAFLGSGRGLLLVGLTAWTATGTLTLAAGQHLLTAVVYAATAALCTTMTVLLVLVRIALGPRRTDPAP